MAGGCRSCGGARSAHARVVGDGAAQVSGRDSSQDFFKVRARYTVVRRSGETEGKSFATLTAAEDYARRTGGVIRETTTPIEPADS